MKLIPPLNTLLGDLGFSQPSPTTMAPQNTAAWLMEKQDTTLVVSDASYNKPSADEIVIKTKAVAINPADFIIQKMGILIETYPAILGCDVAGVVEEVGSSVQEFQPGDRVIGQTNPLSGGNNKYSGFQQYVVLKMPLIAKIPPTAIWTDATVLPLGINTAASCLFHHDTLALEMPPSQSTKHETLLIWGASSSVGSCGVVSHLSTSNIPLFSMSGGPETFSAS